MREIRIDPDDAGQRLDRFLRKYLKDATLPTIYKLIRTKQVTVNGSRAKPHLRLETGDRLVLHPNERRVVELRGRTASGGAADAPDLEVLYEDDDVLAVSKPPFLLVHAGRKEGEATLLDSVAAYLGPSSAETFRPNLAHRIDRLTSGVVLVGKTAAGLRGLTRALRKRKVEKVYLALLVGELEDDAGQVDAPIARRETPSKKRLSVRVDPSGKAACTTYRVLGRSRGFTLVAARPLSGRTHQIRAHFAHIGHPVAGDPTYGVRDVNRRLRGKHALWRQWLHAFSIRFVHPVKGVSVEVSAPLPEDLVRVLRGEGFPLESLPEGALDGPHTS